MLVSGRVTLEVQLDVLFFRAGPIVGGEGGSYVRFRGRMSCHLVGISCHSGKAINDSKILIVLNGRSFGRRSNLSEHFVWSHEGEMVW